MEKRLKKWEWAGAIFCVILAFPLHFAYEAAGGDCPWLAVIVPVNESVWEHLKLMFYPASVFAAIEYFFVGRKFANFFISKALGIFLGMAAIAVAFYTYSGIIGKIFLIADILTYVLGTAVLGIVTYKTVIKGKWSAQRYKYAALILAAIMVVIFAVYTFNPPNISIFQDEAQTSSMLLF